MGDYFRTLNTVSKVHQYNSTDPTTIWKKYRFISFEGSNFHMIDNLSIAIPKSKLKSLSVHEILLPKYVIRLTSFRYLLLKVEVTPSCLKHMNLEWPLKNSKQYVNRYCRSTWSLCPIAGESNRWIQASSRIWIRILHSIYYNDNRFADCNSI